MDRVALEDELVELEQVHRKLDESIARGYTNYIADENLGKMKQEKLIIKREIENIRTRLGL
jgi:hypothetical protein